MKYFTQKKLKIFYLWRPELRDSERPAGEEPAQPGPETEDCWYEGSEERPGVQLECHHLGTHSGGGRA